MKKSYIAVALAVSILGGSTLTSCIGSFQLTNKLLSWNKSVGNKFVNELLKKEKITLEIACDAGSKETYNKIIS